MNSTLPKPDFDQVPPFEQRPSTINGSTLPIFLTLLEGKAKHLVRDQARTSLLNNMQAISGVPPSTAVLLLRERQRSSRNSKANASPRGKLKSRWIHDREIREADFRRFWKEFDS